MADRLRDALAPNGMPRSAVVGPAPAYIARRADRWRWNVVLRGARPGRAARRRRRRAVVGRRRPGIAAVTRTSPWTGPSAHAGQRGSCDDAADQSSEEQRTMTEPLDPSTPPEPTPDETFTWSGDPGAGRPGRRRPGVVAARGGPTGSADRRPVPRPPRRSSIRSAKRSTTLPSGPPRPSASSRPGRPSSRRSTADRAAPLAKRAGEVTSDASGKLAERSRSWASELRASLSATETATPPDAGSPAAPDAPPPAATDAGPTPSDGATPS